MIAAFLVCLALAGFVGAVLWFAYALAVVSARAEDATPALNDDAALETWLRNGWTP